MSLEVIVQKIRRSQGRGGMKTRSDGMGPGEGRSAGVVWAAPPRGWGWWKGPPQAEQMLRVRWSSRSSQEPRGACGR